MDARGRLLPEHAVCYSQQSSLSSQKKLHRYNARREEGRDYEGLRYAGGRTRVHHYRQLDFLRQRQVNDADSKLDYPCVEARLSLGGLQQVGGNGDRERSCCRYQQGYSFVPRLGSALLNIKPDSQPPCEFRQDIHRLIKKECGSLVGAHLQHGGAPARAEAGSQQA